MLRPSYDAIVVGARCAGAPTAMLLARAGGRVLLVDRATFPSDTISGHAIKLPGVAYLERWGLLDDLLDAGTPRIRKMAMWVGDRALPGPPPESLDLPVLAPRRTVLDLALVRAAASAGVDVLERTSVSSILVDDDQVIGIESPSHTGRPLRARAPIVIGADGKHSYVAHQVGAEYEQYQAPVSIAYYSYWSGCAFDGISLFLAPGHAAGIFPTNDGQVLAFVQVPWIQRHAFRTDVVANYLTTLHSFPAIADALSGATMDGPLRGMLDLPAYFRRSYGPGWALAGDAAHHKDPIIARGITDAFRDADLLARAIGSGLGGETDLQPALAQYHRQREAASWRMNELNHRLAELPEDLNETAKRLAALLTEEARIDSVGELDLAA
jgi:flavin-dependent dehydrogenase